MKVCSMYRNVLALLYLFLWGEAHLSYASELAFPPEKSVPIEFDKIPANEFHWDNNVLTIKVNKSSSALLIPFKSKRRVQGISFQWQSSKELKLTQPQQQKEKEGDDALIRISLMHFGKPPWIPFSTPGWVKLLKKHLKFPTDGMTSVIAGGPMAPGEAWESPYTDSITNYSVASKPLDGPWKISDMTFPKPIEVVGLWLMSDGDNTGHSFTTKIRHLKIREAAPR